MKMIFLSAASAAVLAAPAFAQDWRLDHDASKVTAEMTVFNAPATANFDRFDADISFDPAALDTASIEATVYAASGVVRNADGRQISDYQNALEGSSGLNVETYEEIRFVSETIVATDAGYEALGTLSVRDVTRQITLSFTLDIAGDRAVAEGGFTLSREDLGLVNSSWGNNIADAIDVQLYIEADRASSDGAPGDAALD
jgi:polyisoprenoid-binding protein YceI